MSYEYGFERSHRYIEPAATLIDQLKPCMDRHESPLVHTQRESEREREREGGGGMLFPAFISERCVIGRIPLKLPESRSRAEIENAIQYLAVDKLIKHWHTLEI